MPDSPILAGPSPDTRHSAGGHERLAFLKNIITNSLIEVGDYTYYDDFEPTRNFECNVLYHCCAAGISASLATPNFVCLGGKIYQEWRQPLHRLIHYLPVAGFWAGRRRSTRAANARCTGKQRAIVAGGARWH
jgi:hypothetical protein